MKRLIYAAMLLLGVGMMVSCGGNGQSKKNNNETANDVTQDTPSVEEVAEPVDNRPRVYSNAFDGFVNIRETPEAKAPVLGVLRNGPEGAVLLDTVGKWTKIDYNGIVGYVVSKYVQDTPEEAYTGDVTLDDIAGLYFNQNEFENGCLFLFFDGSYVTVGYNWPEEMGNYKIQNNEVKFMPTAILNAAEDPTEWIPVSNKKPYTLSIDSKKHTVGKYKKDPFLTEKEVAKAKAEYEEDWEFMVGGDGACMRSTLKEFKKKSASDYR